MDNVSEFTRQFMKIVSQAFSKKMYGSIEVYFEGGKVTQVTQRIINKINRKEKKAEGINLVKGGHGNGKERDDLVGQNTPLTS